jgi:2-enoate reductase
LKTEVTTRDIDALEADAVVIATGATSAPLNVKTDPKARVQSAESLLLSGDEFSNVSIVVIGAGMVGCETALACAERGAGVVLIEALADVGRDCEPISRSVLVRHMADANVRILSDARVTEIAADAVIVEAEGGTGRVRADRVVIAVGAVACDQLAQELRGHSSPVFVAGDARSPRGIAEAVYEGWRAGQHAACVPGRTLCGQEE